MTPISVSVFLLTYNQQEFIAQTIESVLMQRTNFRYQLVIGEDASTDKTGEICKRYARDFPDKIKLLPSDRNLGLIYNFIRTYKECDGKYVAILDGDDYWTDPLKLQKQVDFLEKNPDYSLIFTSFKFLFPNGKIISKDYSTQSDTTGFEDLIFKNYICSATALFKNKRDQNDLPDWLDRFPYGDWPLYLWVTKNGERIKFLNDSTAIYRKEIGVSEKMKQTLSNIISVNKQIIECVSRDTAFRNYREKIDSSWRNHALAYMGSLFQEKKYKEGLLEMTRLFPEMPVRVIKTALYLIRKNIKMSSLPF